MSLELSYNVQSSFEISLGPNVQRISNRISLKNKVSLELSYNVQSTFEISLGPNVQRISD